MSISDEINLSTLPPASGIAQNYVLIFFIPGNPGLVEYYRPFLINLKKNLDSQISQNESQLKDTQYLIYGASLAGFDVNPGSRQTPSTAQDFPLSLDAQVDDVYTRLESTAKRLCIEHDIKSDLPVVVIGHSIGAYMALQTVARWQESAKAGPTHTRASTGICLFPTIYELNLSPTGRKVGVSDHTYSPTTPDDTLTLTSKPALDENPSLCTPRPHPRKTALPPRSPPRTDLPDPPHNGHAPSRCPRHGLLPKKPPWRAPSPAHGERRARAADARPVARRVLGRVVSRERRHL